MIHNQVVAKITLKGETEEGVQHPVLPARSLS